MAKVKLVSVLLVLVVVAIVFWQNNEAVQFRFIGLGSISVSKTLLILGSMLVGVVGTLVVQLFWRQRKRLREAQDSGLST